MIPAVRREKILELLSHNTIISTDELLNLLNISISTLRRDLIKLSDDGRIELLHGGGVRLSDNTTELNLSTKLDLNNQAKKNIAKKAVSYIEDGDVIFIDPSSTTFQMIDFLPENITVCTNGIAHINKLTAKGITSIMVGGSIKTTTDSCIGPISEETLRQLNFNKCFLGANGFSINAGITNHDINEKTIKQIAISNSTQCYFLIDHTKFNVVTMVKICPLASHLIITDKIFDSIKDYTNIIDANR